MFGAAAADERRRCCPVVRYISTMLEIEKKDRIAAAAPSSDAGAIITMGERGEGNGAREEGYEGGRRPRAGTAHHHSFTVMNVSFTYVKIILMTHAIMHPHCFHKHFFRIVKR